MDTAESLLSFAIVGKLLFGLFAVVSIIALLVLILRILQRKKDSFAGFKGDLKVKKTSYLGPKQKLSVIQWKDHEYLLALTPTGGFLIDKKPLAEPSNEKNKEKVL